MPSLNNSRFQTSEKEASRQLAVSWSLEEGKSLLDRHGKFQRSWVEMMGDTGDLTYNWLHNRLNSPKQFLAIDIKPDVYVRTALRLVANKADQFPFDLGDAYNHSIWAAKNADPPARIFNLDNTNMVGSPKWWKGYGGPLLDIVDACVTSPDHICLLILNQTLDVPKLGKSSNRSRLISNIQQLCQVFERYGAREERFLGKGRRALDAFDADPNLGEKEASDLGAYRLYRGVGERVLRMATLYLRFMEGPQMRIRNDQTQIRKVAV